MCRMSNERDAKYEPLQLTLLGEEERNSATTKKKHAFELPTAIHSTSAGIANDVGEPSMGWISMKLLKETEKSPLFLFENSWSRGSKS